MRKLPPVPIAGHSRLVGELLDIHVPLPAYITPTCTLERADQSSFEYLSALTDSCSLFGANPFENSFDKNTKKISVLDRSEWKYVLLRSSEPISVHWVVYASSIVEHGIYLGPIFSPNSLGSSAGLHDRFTNAITWWNEKVITAATISDWARLAQQIESVFLSHADIRRSIQMFHSLSGNNPTYDPLTVLGYFIVIESLLTHKPDPKDPTDSISRQMRSKIRLLGNRMSPKLDHSGFDCDQAKVWSALYSYRSTLAHGGDPDFTKGDLTKLKDQATAVNFLQETCRALLRKAVSEPDLVTDLKSC